MVAQEKIAHQRLGTGQKLIGKYKPGTDVEATVAYMAGQRLDQVGLHIRQVLQDHRLSVEQERGVGGVVFQNLKELLNQPHQPEAKLLESTVPLAVPVGVETT